MPMSHKPRRTALLIAAALCVAAAAARTAADFFVAAPDSVIRLLPQATRLDMLDYNRYGSDRPSTNQFNGPAILRTESDAIVEFDVDRDISMQLAVIPAGSDTVVALVTTCLLPVPDSSIQYFDTSWRPVAKGLPAIPAYTDWLTPEATRTPGPVEVELPFIPVSAAFSPGATVLTFPNQAQAYLDSATWTRIQPMMTPAIAYDIKGGRFTQRR